LGSLTGYSRSMDVNPKVLAAPILSSQDCRQQFGSIVERDNFRSDNGYYSVCDLFGL
jgi:hypothetical protein